MVKLCKCLQDIKSWVCKRLVEESMSGERGSSKMWNWGNRKNKGMQRNLNKTPPTSQQLRMQSGRKPICLRAACCLNSVLQPWLQTQLHSLHAAACDGYNLSKHRPLSLSTGSQNTGPHRWLHWNRRLSDPERLKNNSHVQYTAIFHHLSHLQPQLIGQNLKKNKNKMSSYLQETLVFLLVVTASPPIYLKTLLPSISSSIKCEAQAVQRSSVLTSIQPTLHPLPRELEQLGLYLSPGSNGRISFKLFSDNSI